MAISRIQDTRVRALNDLAPRAKGDYVLYWMQQSQRAEHNQALEHAARRANQLAKPLLVGFGLMDDYPEANARHYRFMLEGLAEVASALQRRGIRFVLHRGAPDAIAIELARKALLVVCDRGYLRHQKTWRQTVAEAAGCRVEQVEADAVVPVNTASDRREYAARTLRPKLHRHLDAYLVDLDTTAVEHDATGLSINGEDLSHPDALLDRLKVDRSVAPVERFRGGTGEAKRVLRRFLDRRFSSYREHRNQPQTDDVSHMSKYLHFGQISPVWLALQIRDAAPASDENRAAFLEELVVRRELAINFCEFEPDYDTYACLPEWAQTTLAEHRDDPRPHHYTRAQLEAAETHDPYWNAAMREMVHTGYMHNHMRMYWGKKILEWTNTPEYAFRTTLELNNKYFLDGRDTNSFAGVAWIFGNHDRAWTEREVFGKVRYMNAAGLERKCDIQGYVQKVEARTDSAS
jgi:deoxyribodipyrimidine photo-lyase